MGNFKVEVVNRHVQPVNFCRTNTVAGKQKRMLFGLLTKTLQYDIVCRIMFIVCTHLLVNSVYESRWIC
jgi:hypothetical protein